MTSTATTISAAVVPAPGAVPAVGTVDFPVRHPGATVLEVVAAPLNPLDLLVASGEFHSARHETAYVPGSECVGVVVESDRYPMGALLYAECHPSPTSPGAFATHVVVSDDDLLPLPPQTDPVLGAAVANSGVAAYLPLVDVAGLRPGETVLVLGATGAVGQLAVQIARAHGAGRVVGVGRDRAVLDGLSARGADAVVALHPDDDAELLSTRLGDAAGPVDVVLDGLFGRPLEAALRVCGPGARVVNIGHLAGPEALLPAGLLRGRQLTVSGYAGVHVPLVDKGPALSWLWNAVTEGRLDVPVRTFPLDRLPEAWRAQAGSPHAKCVLLPNETVSRESEQR